VHRITLGFIALNCMKFVRFSGYQSIDITKANVRDVQILNDVKKKPDCLLLRNREYSSSTQQLDLFQTANIVLETPMRMNQKGNVKQPYLFRKSREIIDHFSRNYVTNSK
jgi:hypothetical protein